MTNLKHRPQVNLSESNIMDVILSQPDARKSAICYFLSGNPDVIAVEFSVSSPSGKVSLHYFPDGSILVIRDDIAIPYFSFEDYSDSLPLTTSRVHLSEEEKEFVDLCCNFSK